MTNLQILIKEIETENLFLEETIKDIDDLLQIVAEKNANRIEIAAGSQFLSQFYNGIENILKRILKFSKINIPNAENWHTELLYFFDKNSEKKKIPLFDEEHIILLNRYKKIRHVVRQGYNFNLDWEKLRIALENIDSFFKEFKIVISDYIKLLKEN
mgnify:CR=1 FL=1